MIKHSGRRQRWNNAAANQGMPKTASKSQAAEKSKDWFPYRLQKEYGPDNTLILDFQSPELETIYFCCLKLPSVSLSYATLGNEYTWVVFLGAYSLSCVWPSVTPSPAACQTPLSMRFSRKEYWSRLPFPTPGDIPWYYAFNKWGLDLNLVSLDCKNDLSIYPFTL